MKHTARTSTSLTKAYQSSPFGRRATLLLALTFTLASAIFVSLVGPLAEPDFWQPVPLVDHIANLMFLFFVSYAALLPLGYSWHFFLSSVDAAVALSAHQITHQHLPWLISRMKELRASVFRRAVQTEFLSARAKRQTEAVQALNRRRRLQQRSKSKAPILLFQQAPLLLAP